VFSVLFRVPLSQQGQCAVEYLAGAANGRHSLQLALLLVEVDQRACLFLINPHANANGVGVVVSALGQFSAAVIARVRNFGGMAGEMKSRLTRITGTSTTQSIHQILQRQLEADRCVERDLLVSQHLG
jgi:hypothetical protein